MSTKIMIPDEIANRLSTIKGNRSLTIATIQCLEDYLNKVQDGTIKLEVKDGINKPNNK